MEWKIINALPLTPSVKVKIHLLDKGLYISTDIDPTVIVGRRIAVFRKFGKEQFILCRGTTVKHIVTLPDQQISIFPGQILIQRIQIRSFLQFSGSEEAVFSRVENVFCVILLNSMVLLERFS